MAAKTKDILKDIYTFINNPKNEKLFKKALEEARIDNETYKKLETPNYNYMEDCLR